MTIDVSPRRLLDASDLTPAIFENSCSNGIAMELAIVSALVPGSFAITLIVGISLFAVSARTQLTPRNPKAPAPAISMPAAIMRRCISTYYPEDRKRAITVLRCSSAHWAERCCGIGTNALAKRASLHRHRTDWTMPELLEADRQTVEGYILSDMFNVCGDK